MTELGESEGERKPNWSPELSSEQSRGVRDELLPRRMWPVCPRCKGESGGSPWLVIMMDGEV
jgi:hypothetical protein